METLLHNRISPTFKYQDEQFSLMHTHHCHLLLSSEPHAFHIGVVNATSQTCLWAESYALTSTSSQQNNLAILKAIASQHEFLGVGFWNSVKILIDNQSFTLIPASLFRKEYAARYLYLAQGASVQSTEEVHHHYHDSIAAVNVFSADSSVIDWVLDLYPFQDIKVVHQTSALIEQALYADKHHTLHIYFGEGSFTMLSAASGQLQYCNRFQYKNTSDLVYFVLFVQHELGIPLNETTLLLYGKIQDEVQTELAKYVSDLRLGNQIKVNFTENYRHQAPPHVYASLMAGVSV